MLSKDNSRVIGQNYKTRTKKIKSPLSCLLSYIQFTNKLYPTPCTLTTNFIHIL